MSDDKPFGELGDLVEELVPIITNLADVLDTEGPDAVRGALLQMRSVQERMTPETRAKLRHTYGEEWGVALMVATAMIDKGAGIRTLLAWTEPLLALEPLQREQQRLRDAGVRTETATATLAKAVATQQLQASA